MIGEGVFTSLGIQLEYVHSPVLILLLWALGGLMALTGAWSYAALGTIFKRSGGEYHFLSQLFHPILGYLSGVTCPDCSDTYNPHYYVDGYLIKYSDTYINETSNITQDVLPASEFLLSPNPVNDILTLSTTSTAGYARFLIIDVNGKIIQSREVDAMALYGGRVEMPVYDLEAGTYFVRIFTKEGSQTKKFIKH